MEKKDDEILLSPKYGVNPSVVHCMCCSKAYGVAMLGKLKNDAEAPKDIYNGLCNECGAVIEQDGVLVIEVRDGESGNNPFRTGRYVGVSKEFKEQMEIKHPISFMEHTLFEKIFGSTFKKEEEKKNTQEGDIEKEKPKVNKETKAKAKTPKAVKKKITIKNKERAS